MCCSSIERTVVGVCNPAPSKEVTISLIVGILPVSSLEKRVFPFRWISKAPVFFKFCTKEDKTNRPMKICIWFSCSCWISGGVCEKPRDRRIGFANSNKTTTDICVNAAMVIIVSANGGGG